MRIELEISKEFEEHFKQDKFKDSFERIMVDIKHSLEGINICAGRYEYETIEMLQKAFENSRKAYDVDKIISQLGDYGNEEIEYYRNTPYENCIRECVSKAIEIVKQGSDTDDVCEWYKVNGNAYKSYTHAEIYDSRVFDWHKCPYCEKKIKIVGD